MLLAVAQTCLPQLFRLLRLHPHRAAAPLMTKLETRLRKWAIPDVIFDIIVLRFDSPAAVPPAIAIPPRSHPLLFPP